jgi:hypothetical protein
MCQQCIKLGIAAPINKKGGIVAIRREKKENTDDKQGKKK